MASAALVWAAVIDVRTHLIPRIAGIGILVIGLGYLLLNALWLESAFFLAAIWGSRGEFGWFGGGDAQLAFGLVALGRDWWILAYLFGGTILLGFVMMFRRHGFDGGIERSWWVFRNLNSPDEEAIKFPWAVLASAGGIVYMWVFPGLM
jgi:hypothetical protein